MNYKKKMLPLISINILFCIVFIIVITRGSMATYDEIRMSAFMVNIEIIENKDFKVSEKIVINMLNLEVKPEDSQEIYNNSSDSYVKYLEEHFNNPEINIDKDIKDKVIKLIECMLGIMIVEKERNLNKMSIDGGEIVIDIYQQVYEQYDLENSNTTGTNIILIVDNKGNFLYLNEKPVDYGGFKYLEFTLILGIWFVLFVWCYLLTKKNRLIV